MTESGIDQLLTSACCTRQSERAFKFEAFRAPSALCGNEQVSGAKLLGDIFQNNLSFDQHVAAVSVLIYSNYFGTRVRRRHIWTLYFMHLLCLRFDMLCVPGAAF